jgi:nucleoside-diphosphate-sugar epimerase
MRILLTGASGFMGRNTILYAPGNWQIVALYARDQGFPDFIAHANRPNVIPVACDLSNPEEVAALVRKHGAEWECCLYLAAKVDIPWSVKEPAEDLRANAFPLLTLLDRIHAHKLVYFSSGAVYDGASGEVGPQTPLSPTLPYAISKAVCERYVEFYHRRRGSIGNYLIVRFFGAYGPYEAPHKIYTRLIRAFAWERRTNYTIYGDGQNLIDAMYIDDAVEAIRRLVAGDHWNDTVNLAGGNPLTIQSLVQAAAKALGAGPIRIEKEGIANESNRFWGSTREMKELYGFEPQIGLAEGFQRFREFLFSRWSAGQ